MKPEIQQITAILMDMKEDIGEMKSDLKSLGELKEKVEKHENFINNLQGKIAFIGVALGFIGTLIGNWIKNNF